MNKPTDIQKFFGTPSDQYEKVSTREYAEFWKSLSDEEKDYYRNADLTV